MMPALNFHKHFVEKVESGTKCQTIRELRKDGRNPRIGQTLYLYTGQRTKYCRKLGEVICKSVQQFSIQENLLIVVGTKYLDIYEENSLAKADGFETYLDFIEFFRKTYGLPFYGLLIKWGV